MRVLTPRERTKDAYLRRTYHCTLETYNAVMKYQKNKCAICKRHVSNFKNSFAVDHDHITGLVRGLLCWECNRVLGKWRDNFERVVAAAEYVSNPPMTVVLGQPLYTAPGRIGTKKRAKDLAKLKAKKVSG